MCSVKNEILGVLIDFVDEITSGQGKDVDIEDTVGKLFLLATGKDAEGDVIVGRLDSDVGVTASASVQGRSEALQIILNLDPEEGLDEYLSGTSCGEYESVIWNSEALKKLFHIGDEYENSPGCKISAAADSLYWENVAKGDDMDTLKGLVSDLLCQIKVGKLQTGQNCTVDILETWIK